MTSSTPYLDALSSHFPQEFSSIMASLTSEQARSAINTLLAFASGGECPTDVSPQGQLEWARKQPPAMRAIQDMVVQKGTKRGRAASTDGECVDSADVKRQKTTDVLEDDRPIFTLPSISTTSPVRKKVDITIHEKTIRFVNPSSRAVESSIPLPSLSRAFLVPTRGKAKQHWTVIILSSDVPEKGKVTSSNLHQIIFGLDAISTSKFDTTSYSGSSTSSTSTVTKGEETLAPLRSLLSHLPIPVLEASSTVFRSACATPKSGHSAAGVDAYLAAKQGTLWFFDSGILWGESKPCEFWAIGDLVPKDGVRLISATGRTCSVILGRKAPPFTQGHKGEDDLNGEGGDIVETEFSMVDGREQDPINAWVRQRKHLLGKGSAPPSSKPEQGISSKSMQEQPSTVGATAANGPAWDDSDSDDEDYEDSSEEIDNSSSSDSEASERGSNLEDELEEENNRGSDVVGEESGEESEEELQEKHHPLMRQGAMPRMSKAAIDAVVNMMNEMGGSEEEDELDDS